MSTWRYWVWAWVVSFPYVGVVNVLLYSCTIQSSRYKCGARGLEASSLPVSGLQDGAWRWAAAHHSKGKVRVNIQSEKYILNSSTESGANNHLFPRHLNSADLVIDLFDDQMVDETSLWYSNILILYLQRLLYLIDSVWPQWMILLSEFELNGWNWMRWTFPWEEKRRVETETNEIK